MNGENDDRGARWKRALSQPLEMWSWNHQRPAITARRPVNPLKDRGRGSRGTEKRKMKDMTVETLNFIILCMGLLFVMAGILLIVVDACARHRPGTHTGSHVGWARWRRPDVCLHPRTVAHGRNRHNGGRPSMTSIDGLFAILEDRGLMPAVALFSLSAVFGLLYLSSGNPKAPNPHLRRSRVLGYAALTCLAMACLAAEVTML